MIICSREVRKLGSLLQLFNEQQITHLKNKNGLDMLLSEKFNVFKTCIEARILTNDLKAKARFQHGLQYLLQPQHGKKLFYFKEVIGIPKKWMISKS